MSGVFENIGSIFFRIKNDQSVNEAKEERCENEHKEENDMLTPSISGEYQGSIPTCMATTQSSMAPTQSSVQRSDDNRKNYADISGRSYDESIDERAVGISHRDDSQSSQPHGRQQPTMSYSESHSRSPHASSQDDLDLQALVEDDMETTVSDERRVDGDIDAAMRRPREDDDDDDNSQNKESEMSVEEEDLEEDEDLMNPFPHLIPHHPLYRTRSQMSSGQPTLNGTVYLGTNNRTDVSGLEASVKSNSSIASSTLSDASMSSPTQASLTVGPMPIPNPFADGTSPLASSGSSPATASRNGPTSLSSSSPRKESLTSSLASNRAGEASQKENLKHSWFSLPSPRERAYSFSSSPFGKVYHLDGREVNDPKAVSNSIYIGPKHTELLVYTEENVHRNITADEYMTAGDLCHVLIHRTRAMENSVWCIVEQFPALGIERSLEDHEKILEIVELTWPSKVDNSSTSSSPFLARALASASGSSPPSTDSAPRFAFRKDFRRFELFKNPLQTFPLQMLSLSAEANTLETAEIYKRIVSIVSVDPVGDETIGYRDNSSSEKVPELQGHVVMREMGKKSWRKAFAFLRGSGLYVSSKGTSKEPRHMVLISGLQESSIYVATQPKKTGVNPPTEFCFCLKPDKAVAEPKEMLWVCVEDERQRQCWLAGLRLAKFGQQLRENYREAERRERRELRSQSRGRQNTYPSTMASPGDDVHWSQNRVAMDFTGPDGGRVIEDPVEAEGAAIEEAHVWRQRATSSFRSIASGERWDRSETRSSPLSPSPHLPSSPHRAAGFAAPLPRPHSTKDLALQPPRFPHPGAAVHLGQPWFHGKISREEAQDLIKIHGATDGLFLLRESLSYSGTYVLTLAHGLKTRHFRITAFQEAGRVCFSLDGGRTRFNDLIQLVEFYQVNIGGLPVRLTNSVYRVT